LALASVYDAALDVAQTVGAELGAGVPKTVDELLSASDVDAVAICSSTPTHAELIERAASAGKAVLCEKPVALDLAEIDRALAAVTAAGVPFQIGFNRRYLMRASVELIGLGANLPEDAIYPLVYTDADGKPFTGENRYVWHLEPDELPPVNAFWSLTLYDAEGYQVANELNRFAIGDRDGLATNGDGSLDIFIQHDQPEQGSSNWLPAPAGEFNLCARLYYPKPEALNGAWTPPGVAHVG
jgi:hypothetical protein